MRARSLVPTAWTRPLQWLTSVVSVVTTAGTAVVLGYVTPELLDARFSAEAVAEFDLPGWRFVGVVFLLANTIGVLLGFLVRFRSAWARRRVPTTA